MTAQTNKQTNKPGPARRIPRPRRRPGFKDGTVDVVLLELRDAARARRCDPCGRAGKHGGAEARARDRRREPVDLIRSRLGCCRLASEACAGADPSTEGLGLAILKPAGLSPHPPPRPAAAADRTARPPVPTTSLRRTSDSCFLAAASA